MFCKLPVNVLHLGKYSFRSIEIELKKKWISDLPNVNLFIELVERKTEYLNPSVFYEDTESYFEKLFLLKSDLEKLNKPHQIIKKKRKKSFKKCIR